jgi:hypothetical protein
MEAALLEQAMLEVWKNLISINNCNTQ